MPSIRAVLWDFDGTLADSTELIMRSWRHMMTTHHGACPPDEEWLSGFGMTLETQVRRFARSDDEHLAMLHTYRTFQREHHAALLHPFPRIVETVDALVRRGTALAIVTSKHREATLEGMGLCGLLERFEVVVTPEDVREPKPHPEPVLHALDRLGAAAGEALFVGDSPHDMAAGRAAGVRTAAAAWGPFPREALERERPDHWLAAPEDVLPLVEGVPVG